MAAAHAAAVICRPFRAPQFCNIHLLGLTPQAKYLSPLRGSVGYSDSIAGPRFSLIISSSGAIAGQ